jgi:hypothetical protein
MYPVLAVTLKSYSKIDLVSFIPTTRGWGEHKVMVRYFGCNEETLLCSARSLLYHICLLYMHAVQKKKKKMLTLHIEQHIFRSVKKVPSLYF